MIDALEGISGWLWDEDREGYGFVESDRWVGLVRWAWLTWNSTVDIAATSGSEYFWLLDSGRSLWVVSSW